MNDSIKIELSSEEAMMFRKFQEHHDKFDILLKNGIFNIRNGTALIGFDKTGCLTQIDINVLMYKKGYPQLVIVSSS